MAERKDAPGLLPRVAAFALHLGGERRLSEHTVAAYRRDVEQLATFLEHRFQIDRWQEVGKLELRSWLAELSKENGASTIGRKLASLRAFFKFHGRGDRTYDNPAEQLATPRVKRPMALVLNMETAAELVESPEQAARVSAAQRARDRLLLELLYGSGLRLAELAGLDLAAVDERSGVLRVLGKGRKERLVPMSGACRQAYTEYLVQRPALCHPKSGTQDMAAVLLGRWGGRLGRRQIQKLVQKYGALGAGRADVHPHALRHMCATHMLEGGADLRVIQEFLGHKSLSTTQRYTHLSVEQLLGVYDKSHPLAVRKRVPKA